MRKMRVTVEVETEHTIEQMRVDFNAALRQMTYRGFNALPVSVDLVPPPAPAKSNRYIPRGERIRLSLGWDVGVQWTT